MLRNLSLLFSILYGYAIVRYHFGKSVPLEDWFFILNKAFAWFAMTLISLTLLKENTLQKFQFSKRHLGQLGFLFGILHICSALLLFSEKYYPKFYSDHTFSSIGWTSISVGIISILIYSLPLYGSFKKYSSENKLFKFGKIGLLINIIHPILIGYSGWFTINKWPLFMPPITLLAVLFALLLFMLKKSNR